MYLWCTTDQVKTRRACEEGRCHNRHSFISNARLPRYSYRMQLFCATFSLSATFQVFDSHITWVIALLSSSLDLIAGLGNASAVALISADSTRVSTAGHESCRKRLRSELRCLPTLFMSLQTRTVPRNCTVHCRPEHPADACMLVIKK